MNIGFVFPVADRAYLRRKPIRVQGSIYLGISYISSVLKLEGHRTRLFVLTPRNEDRIETLLREFDPQLVCCAGVSTTYHLVRSLAARYKKMHPDVFLVAGGCHVSINPEGAIADAFDAICIGEGEQPTLELAGQLERGLRPANIRNLWIRNGAEVEKNPTRPHVEDLDRLPFPDRGMWREWIRYPETPPAVLISRGCPFNCTYCCHHRLAALAEGTYYRFRSPRNILEEIDQYLEEYPGTREVYLETETIFVNLDYVRDLCSAIERYNSERETPLSFGANLRLAPGMDIEALFQILSRANFKHVNIGLESGSESVRSRVLRRRYSNDDLVAAVACARKHGIDTTLYVMIGLPGETLADFQQTVEVSRRCAPNACLHNIFYPYPGTEIALRCEQEGLLDQRIDIESVDERKTPVLVLPGFPQRDVLRSYIWFEYNAFRGRRPLHKLLLRVLQSKVLTVPALERFLSSLLDIAPLFRLKRRLIDH